MNRKFDDMIKDAERNRREVYETIDGEVSKMKENLVLLRNLWKNSGDDDEHEEIINKLGAVKCIGENVKGNLSRSHIYKYYELMDGQSGEELVFGNIMKKEINVKSQGKQQRLKVSVENFAQVEESNTFNYE